MTETNVPLQRFVEAAQAFCQMVEGYGSYGFDNKRWLEELGQVLLRLHATIGALKVTVGEGDYSMLQDLEERFVLFQQLKRFLGGLDEYWSEGDLEAGDGLKTGSLADDVTDMYFDLRRGLNQLQAEPGEERKALEMWLYSYRVHWQQHLRDATRQLFEFRIAS